jgi:hypothetical protein
MNDILNQNNYNGEKRKIGFELEFSGISAKEVAKIIQDSFGGKIVDENKTVYKVEETELGDFKVELDAIPIQNVAKRLKDNEEKNSGELIDKIDAKLSSTIMDVSEIIVPMEIVGPPVKVDEVNKIDLLCDKLKDKNAKSTKDKFYYAFGLHINPEVISTNTKYIVKHIQSYLLLEPWLVKAHEIDWTRRVTSFVDPFPKSYKELLLDSNYNPTMKELISDYHKHNPTRNRSLDMTPLFAYIDEELTRELFGKDEKINKRPTFHYRLPNCDLTNPKWSINKELQIWMKVEKLADNSKLLDEMIKKWIEQNENLISLEKFWVDEITDEIEGL